MFRRMLNRTASRLRALLRCFPELIYIEGKEYSTDYHLVHLAKMSWRGTVLRFHHWMLIFGQAGREPLLRWYAVSDVVPPGWQGVTSRLDPRVVESLRRAPTSPGLSSEFGSYLKLCEARHAHLTYPYALAYGHFLQDLVPILLRMKNSFSQVVVSAEFDLFNPYASDDLAVLGFDLAPRESSLLQCGEGWQSFVEAFPGNFAVNVGRGEDEYVRSNVLVVTTLRDAALTIASRVGEEDLNSALINVGSSEEAAKLFRSGSGVLFIVRGPSADGRFLDNQEGVTRFIQERAGCVAVFEALSLREKIALVSHAKCLIGIYGSGLSNMVFLPSGAFVLEFSPKSEVKSCFLSQGRVLGLNYEVALVETVGKLNSGRPRGVRIDDAGFDAIDRAIKNVTNCY